MIFSKNFREIKGDASFRRFFRNTKKNSIFIFSDKEKNKNLLVYDAINKILIKNNIIAPKLLSHNYKKNYIEVQDLGNKTIYQTFLNTSQNQYLIFKKIIKVLNLIQLIKDKKVKNFCSGIYKIKKYENKVLLDEAKGAVSEPELNIIPFLPVPEPDIISVLLLKLADMKFGKAESLGLNASFIALLKLVAVTVVDEPVLK